MPTVEELPQAQSVDAADLLPISQSGTLRAIASGELLASTQSAIMAPTGSLLGRNSLGAGGPEPVSIGLGLSLQGGTVAATGSDHASFPVGQTLGATDQFVLSSAGSPKLVPFSALSAALAGSTGGGQFANLPVVTTLAATDLVAISQGGTNAAITLANFLDGETIDQAAPAGTASDSDTVWVAQGGSTMLRQSFGAIWTWAAGKLPTYKLPVLELTLDTTLDSSVHNGHLLVCSVAITLTPAFETMGSGFFCEVLNLSAGEITFGSGIIVSSGQSTLGLNQFATLRGVTYSQGNVVFAAVSSTATAASTAPGQVTAVSIGDITATGATLSWSAPSSGATPSSYLIQYSISGSNSWSLSSVPGVGTSAALAGLAASTGYVATVAATNAGGTSIPSATVSFTTAAAVIAPGQVSGIGVSLVEATSLQLSWSAPATGGTATGYQVQYSSPGATGWTTYASNVSTNSISIGGLSAGTTYTFQVIASNAGGSGPASASISATTSAAGSSVSSITWNVVPAGPYAAGSGSIGINVHVSPATAPVQFGLSETANTPPTTWLSGTYVNADLWGVYLLVPSATGTYYAWCEGTDGSAPSAYATAILVQ